MHRQAKQWMAAAAVAAAVWFGGASGVSAQGAAGGGGGGANRPADPPQIAYRKAMMQSNGQHIAAIRAILAGAMGGKDALKMHAAALENNGKMWKDMWPEGSTGPTSRSKDEIWTNKEDFAAKVKGFADATHALDEAAEKGDKDATTKALADVQATCGACHTPYRKPAQPAPGQ